MQKNIRCLSQRKTSIGTGGRNLKKKNKIATAGFWLMLFTMVLGIATNGGLGTIMNFLHLPSFVVTFGGAFYKFVGNVSYFYLFTWYI